MSENDWYSEDHATFGDRVSAAREAAGMSQGQLARRLGVKLGTLRNWEQDVSEPRANRLSMAAGVLNVTLSWLLTGEGDGPAAPDHGTDDTELPTKAVLAEMREIRAALRSNLDRLGRLEKQLRRSLERQSD